MQVLSVLQSLSARCFGFACSFRFGLLVSFQQKWSDREATDRKYRHRQKLGAEHIGTFESYQ